MSLGLRISLGLAAVLAVGLASTFEHPPAQTVQRGYRGTGMVEVFNPALLDAKIAANAIPAAFAPASAEGPKAGKIYKNVKVLGDLSVGQFTRLMAGMTTWVAPQQGCGYCHSADNFAADDKYTKVVARRMLQMVAHINADWQPHVGATGVTCYTCHRGQPVPAQLWFTSPGGPHPEGMLESDVGKNLPAPAAGLAALPYDPYTPFLSGAAPIRVAATQALPGTDRSSIKQTEWTYALMVHFSEALGVNCTYCHNSRSFGDWSQSTPQRATAWYGIRMVRDLNGVYLGSLAGVFPQQRLGPTGDVAKVNCATCHQGAYKPLFGVSMLKDWPELAGPVAAK